jgi:hypothetical protein
MDFALLLELENIEEDFENDLSARQALTAVVIAGIEEHARSQSNAHVLIVNILSDMYSLPKNVVSSPAVGRNNLVSQKVMTTVRYAGMAALVRETRPQRSKPSTTRGSCRQGLPCPTA